MTQLLTSSGRNVNLAFVEPGQIHLQDIAYALSNINRFNGHSARPISVAEHSLMVAQIMERHYQITCPAALMAGLLHDAHEALIGDVTQPVKQVLGSSWQVLEERMQRIVLKRFGVYTAFKTNALAIKDADTHALTSEREQLMHVDGGYWDCQATHPALDWVDYRAADDFTAGDWFTAFTSRFEELEFELQARNDAIDGGGA